MAGTYKTPGAFIEEISKLPASIAQVPTAVPVFIGYTETAPASGVNDAVKVKSLIDYQSKFGAGPSLNGVVVNLDASLNPSSVELPENYRLYDSLRMFYANGGGDCYIVSVGAYEFPVTITYTDMTDGIAKLEYVNEPTLICMPDLVLLQDNVASSDDENFGTVQKAALAHAAKMQDRFCILDLREKSSEPNWDTEDFVGQFRDNIGTQNLNYGAAYSPWLKTNLTSSNFEVRDVTLKDNLAATVNLDVITSGAGASAFADLRDVIEPFFDHDKSGAMDYVEWYDSLYTVSGTTADIQNLMTVLDTAAQELQDWSLANAELSATHLSTANTADCELEGWVQLMYNYDDGYDFNDLASISPTTELGIVLPANYSPFTLITSPDYTVYGSGSTQAEYFLECFPKFRAILVEIIAIADRLRALAYMALENGNSVWAATARAIRSEGAVLPPSGAMAGIYATVDNDRGVWKAPANISLNAVVKPTLKYNDAIQAGLNDDSTGKSVNAIRTFTGKGVLVWGARTLAANDLEWRYIPVRRLFITMEESIKKATEYVVFEPNTANTWQRVKGMIENYLTGLWRDGALAGAKPDEAFFVNCGLGTSMTTQDILEGNLIVEIGAAAVRPAEFVILKFSHKLQTS